MADHIEILSLDDRERWEAETSSGGLPSQSWSYAWGLSASGYEPKLAIVRCEGSRMLLPFFERDFMGTTDIATLPGLSGASISGNASALLSLWRQFAVEQGWVAGYIQLATTVVLEEPRPDSDLVAHNAVFLFDLREGLSLNSVSRTVRRKLRDDGLRRRLVTEDPATLGDHLKRFYPETMQRLGAHESFSPETLDRWANAPISCLIGVSVDGEIEGVALGYVAGRHAEGHITATSESGRSLSAFMFWKILHEFHARGAHFANLGGGSSIGDGIYQFKAWLGGTPVPLRSLRQIYDQEKYAKLCERAGAPPGRGWFPAYRARTT